MLSWLPEDVSPYGAGIDALFYGIYYITTAAFFLVTSLMIVFLIKYRRQEGRRAVYTHGNTMLEIVWTIVPALVFIGLGIASKTKWDDLKVNIPETDTIIQVTAQQFNWEVLYPGPDGQFNTADDKQAENEIHVPIGKPIRVILKSKDVIHSFFLPNLRFKQDAVPGREILAWFQANKPGKYEIPCAELCGFGHSGMRGWLYAQNAEDYTKWLMQQWPQLASNNDEIIKTEARR
jgi:cytochrome c oxidase subunit 2